MSCPALSDAPPEGKTLSAETETQALARRLARERKARLQAEAIAEKTTADLYLTVQELKSLNQSLREFVAIASHDLRSPLATVVGFTTTLTKRWASLSDQQRRDFVRTVDKAAHQTQRMVEDLLTVSSIEAGVLETRREAICLAEVTQQAIDSFVQSASRIDMCISREISVVADPDHLQRILVNYVANALKYGAPPIRLEAMAEGEWVAIRVHDEGEGVAEEFVPHLFEKFARAHAQATEAEKGTGLGLSIVRGLALANGGEAWYEPNRPRGSVFALRLPKTA